MTTEALLIPVSSGLALTLCDTAIVQIRAKQPLGDPRSPGHHCYRFLGSEFNKRMETHYPKVCLERVGSCHTPTLHWQRGRKAHDPASITCAQHLSPVLPSLASSLSLSTQAGKTPPQPKTSQQHCTLQLLSSCLYNSRHGCHQSRSSLRAM